MRKRKRLTFTFYSNFLNHHQTPFCNDIYKLLGDGFKFVATEKISQERLDLGYRNMSMDYLYAINSYESKKAYDEAKRIGFESDVVIIGSAPDEFIKERLKKNKLTFRYSERLFKLGKWRILDPRVSISLFRKNTIYRNKKYYMLCASAYTAQDCKMIYSYPNKTYKWGYFPEIKTLNINSLIQCKSDETIKILWVGRMLNLKHPEKPIEIIKRLIDNGYNCHLDMIGAGVLENKLKKMVSDFSLDSNVSFLGSMKSDDVLLNMEKSNIFLFTSDRQEGWGAVLNEAMSSGCGIVANKVIGSVPFLIKDGVNGLIYNGMTDNLYEQVEKLVKDKVFCRGLGTNAYVTIRDDWNSKIAAIRLVEFCEGLLNGKIKKFKNGILSKAE